MTPVESVLWLVKAEPTLCPAYDEAAGEMGVQMRNRSFEQHMCLVCGERSVVALVGHTSIGHRWIDLCMKDYGALLSLPPNIWPYGRIG